MLTKGLGRGGTERLIVGAARLADPHARRRSRSPTCCPGRTPSSPSSRRSARRCTASTVPGPSAWAGSGACGALVREREIDLVHTHMPLPAVVRPGGAARPPARPSCTPSTTCGAATGCRPAGPTPPPTGATHAAIAVSDGVAASIRSSVPVEVVVHGTDPRLVVRRPEARRAARERARPAGRRPRRGHRRQLHGQEGPGHADAGRGRAVPPTAVTCVAVLVGLGPLEEELRALAGRARASAGRVRFPGSRDDVFALLPAFDVFVLSSRFEGLPIALLEAMATGVAPVATRVGGIPEVITDGTTALLVDPGDPAALWPRALDRLLVDDALRAPSRCQSPRSGAGVRFGERCATDRGDLRRRPRPCRHRHRRLEGVA